MRLVTWNCRGGPYRVKARALQKLGFDIAVVPESPEPDRMSESTLWFGDVPNRGLLVAASPAYQLSHVTIDGLPRYVVPVEVRGPEHFLLFAVWAMQNDREDRYVRGVVRAVDRSAPLIAAQPTVLLGDFNSNTRWDRTFARKANHSALVTRLRELGCVSAYHEFHAEEHGAESRPTYFQYNHSDKPYHLDYCFLPQPWCRRIRRVAVGSHDQWRAWSDHRPVIVELSDQASGDEGHAQAENHRVRKQVRQHRRAVVAPDHPRS